MTYIRPSCTCSDLSYELMKALFVLHGSGDENIRDGYLPH